MSNLNIREIYRELFNCNGYTLSEEELIASILAYYNTRNLYFKNMEEVIKYNEDKKNKLIYFKLIL